MHSLEGGSNGTYNKTLLAAYSSPESCKLGHLQWALHPSTASAVPKAKAQSASPLTANAKWGHEWGYLLSERSAWTKSMLDTDISSKFIETTCPCKLQKTLFQMWKEALGLYKKKKKSQTCQHLARCCNGNEFVHSSSSLVNSGRILRRF